MKGIKTTRALCTGIILLGITSTASAELQTRLDGRAVYDTDLNITWMSDANLALTNQFGLSLSTIVSDDTANTVGSTGAMTFTNANFWIGGMNTANYLGFNDWRLPTATNAVRGESFNPDTEMGHLFISEFGGTFGTSIFTNGTQAELDKFTNIKAGSYWTGTPTPPGGRTIFSFTFSGGDLGESDRSNNLATWAVRTGDVGGGAVDVPEPAGLGLLVGGAMGLLGFTKRRRRLSVA